MHSNFIESHFHLDSFFCGHLFDRDSVSFVVNVNEFLNMVAFDENMCSEYLFLCNECEASVFRWNVLSYDQLPVVF